jgi:cytochrome c peroxidase
MTPPYMHNGAIPTLEEAIRHHFDPVASLHAYTGAHLPGTLRATLVDDPATLAAIAENVADAAPLRPLSDAEVDLLVAFLASLTNPIELSRGPEDGVPTFVPSGLPIDRWNGTAHPFRP